MGYEAYMALDEESAVRYVRDKGFFMGDEWKIRCREIGDGNMNYIYRIEDKDKSVILKQAGLSTRLSSGRSISRVRNRREAAALSEQNRLVPGSAPQVYLYDETMDCMVMEDLREYTVMREALLSDGPVCLGFADQISTILAENFIQTSDIRSDHIKKKYEVGRFLNPELCEISERLVFDEPVFNLSGANCVEPENEALVRAEIYENEALRMEAGKLKYKYMTFAQSFLHGDLHTGSIFMNVQGIKVFDSEFAFYGPAGYDLGNVTAHLLLAKANAVLTGRADAAAWAEKAIVDTIRMFGQKISGAEAEVPKDVFEKVLNQWYYKNILVDTAGYMGMELIRRVVGCAKVTDLQSLQRTARAEAERRLLRAGIRLVLDRREFADPAAFAGII